MSVINWEKSLISNKAEKKGNAVRRWLYSVSFLFALISLVFLMWAAKTLITYPDLRLELMNTSNANVIISTHANNSNNETFRPGDQIVKIDNIPINQSFPLLSSPQP